MDSSHFQHLFQKYQMLINEQIEKYGRIVDPNPVPELNYSHQFSSYDETQPPSQPIDNQYQLADLSQDSLHEPGFMAPPPYNMPPHNEIPSSIPNVCVREGSRKSINVDDSSKGKGKRQKTISWVWDHYDRVIMKNKNGEDETRAICKICKQNYSCVGGGTGHLARHASKHDVRNLKQTTLGGNEQGDLTTFKYNQTKTIREMAKCIVRYGLPFIFSEWIHIEKFMRTCLNPSFKSVSRHTIRKEIFNCYNEYRDDLIVILKSLNHKIALTSDGWTCRDILPYICITSHFIDADWTIQRRIVAFAHCEFPHNGGNLSSIIYETIREYGIQDKIISITLDNAKNNDSCVSILQKSLNPLLNGDLFHVRCVCHILNLVVQDGISMISQHIDNIKSALYFIVRSPKHLQQFKAYCKSQGKKSKKFRLDVQHRWNSTYEMLIDCWEFKQEISSFIAMYSGGKVILYDLDWQLADLVKDFLEPFYYATNLLSGCDYPTSHLAIQQIYNISCAFARCRNTNVFKDMITHMENKFMKYWENIPILFCIAAVFDPTCKLAGVLEILKEFGINMNIDVSNIIQHLHENLTTLYNEYDKLFGNNNKTNIHASTCSSSNNSSNPARSLLFKKASSSSSSSSSINELTLYLASIVNFSSEEEVENFNILQWWKMHQTHYPVLACIARDLLTPPVSTVPSESAFSTGGNIVTDQRTRLTPEAVQVLVCLKDWLRAEDYNEKIKEPIEEDEITDKIMYLNID